MHNSMPGCGLSDGPRAKQECRNQYGPDERGGMNPAHRPDVICCQGSYECKLFPPSSLLDQGHRDAHDGCGHHRDSCEDDQSLLGGRIPSECKRRSRQNGEVRDFPLRNQRVTEAIVSLTREPVKVDWLSTSSATATIAVASTNPATPSLR